jgi:hypothetical protein
MRKRSITLLPQDGSIQSNPFPIYYHYHVDELSVKLHTPHCHISSLPVVLLWPTTCIRSLEMQQPNLAGTLLSWLSLSCSLLSWLVGLSLSSGSTSTSTGTGTSSWLSSWLRLCGNRLRLCGRWLRLLGRWLRLFGSRLCLSGAGSLSTVGLAWLLSRSLASLVVC